MNDQSVAVVDFVAKGDSPDQWKMVLVEEGPWASDIEKQLRRVQERLYQCVDAALDGQLAEKFPESSGKEIVIQLDCYNLPREDVAEFFDNFSHGVFLISDYKKALKESSFVNGIRFEVNFDSIH
ncbi:DUF6572 domain-containing protein [Luteimonas mephitis]|uniref:DUF6572 domain-containing protein n=1 Tax=Luteimonas mephitis TaxID=83615 RepID=UPI003A9131E5